MAVNEIRSSEDLVWKNLVNENLRMEITLYNSDSR